MRKIIAIANVSLDGVMQGAGGAQEGTSGGFDLGGWTTRYSSEKSGATVLDMVGTLAKPYDLLLGRKTYDIFASYWLNVSADNRIGPVFTKANKYVLTGGSAKLEWANSHKETNSIETKRLPTGEVATTVALTVAGWVVTDSCAVSLDRLPAVSPACGVGT